MSITKSYNKHTNTYYAYDTSYIWDEEKQRKVQKKVCIGQYDPKTNEIIPNAKRGRPSKQNILSKDKFQIQESNDINDKLKQEFVTIATEMAEIESSLKTLDERFHLLNERMLALCHSVSKNEL